MKYIDKLVQVQVWIKVPSDSRGNFIVWNKQKIIRLHHFRTIPNGKASKESFNSEFQVDWIYGRISSNDRPNFPSST